MVNPLGPFDSSGSTESLRSSTTQKPLSPTDSAMKEVMKAVDLAMNPPSKSLRVRLWSKIAPFLSQDKAKFLSKLILSRSLVARENIAPFAHMLSSRYFPAISEKQIASIDPENFRKMDAKQIKALTSAQISSMSREQIGEFTPREFQAWLKLVSSPRSLLEKRFELLPKDVNLSDDYFTKPDNDEGVMNRDLNRAFVAVSGHQFAHRLSEGEKKERVDAIIQSMEDLIGSNGVRELSKFAHQGFMESPLKMINEQFLDPENVEVIVDGRLSKMEFAVEYNEVVVKLETKGKIFGIRDYETKANKLPFVVLGTLRVPLDELREGNFSHATRQCQFVVPNQQETLE